LNVADYLQPIVDALLLGGLYALMAIGVSLCFGIVRIVNFAHGEFIMLGAYGSFWAFTLLGVDPLISLVPVMLLGGGLGFLLFKLCVQRVLAAPELNQILLTFGLSLVLQNVAVMSWSGDPRSVTTAYSLSSLEWGDVIIPSGRLIAFAIVVVLVAALFAWLRLTELGRAARAVSQNRDAALLMGVNVNFVYALTFAISAALGAGAGITVSFLATITPFMGFSMVIKSFAAVILGGLGNIVGAIAAAFLLGAAETAVSYYVPDGSGWAEGVAFAILFCILILRPRGILGQAVEV
jgi:branched-chain amino acid transport system permease protein